jgi:hypothetical protein
MISINFITKEYFKQHRAVWVGIMLAIAVTACGTNRQPIVQQPSKDIKTATSPTAPTPALVHSSRSPETPQANASSSPKKSLAQSVQDGENSQQQAAQVIRHYYDAINQKDYERAYADWADNGTASQQSFEQFKQGFADTASVKVDIGEPGKINGAVGSLYLEIPITITATTVNGTTQHFTGSYTLKRINDVPGSTPTQRMWHLYSAKITSRDA